MRASYLLAFCLAVGSGVSALPTVVVDTDIGTDFGE